MEPEEFDIQIRSIEELPKHSALHRWELLRHPADCPVECTVSVGFDSPTANDCVAMRLTVRYTSMRGGIMRPLLTYSIRVNYGIMDLKHRAMVTDNAVYLAQGLLPLMLSIGIGALRGMVALRTSGTALAGHPLPVLSIPTLLKHLQPAV